MQTSQTMEFLMKKAEVWEIPELASDPEGIDCFTGEKGTAFMCCGHDFGR